MSIVGSKLLFFEFTKMAPCAKVYGGMCQYLGGRVSDLQSVYFSLPDGKLINDQEL